MTRLVVLLVIALMIAVPADAATNAVSSPTASSVSYPRCSALNRRYPHGVGRVGARDHTSGSKPVTTFKRSNVLYLQNKSLDREKDGIACEKAYARHSV